MGQTRKEVGRRLFTGLVHWMDIISSTIRAGNQVMNETTKAICGRRSLCVGALGGGAAVVARANHALGSTVLTRCRHYRPSCSGLHDLNIDQALALRTRPTALLQMSIQFS